jgi:dihydrofolate reductase
MTARPADGGRFTGPASITLIAAVAANGVIGAGNDLVWRNREDLRRFKALTIDHTLVMGRRTFDSIGRPLPRRHTIVVTRQPHWCHEGVQTAHSLEEAFGAAAGSDVYVAGGGEIYAQAMDSADRLEITHIARDYNGDAHFPPIDPAVWAAQECQQRAGFRWVSYRRR